MCMWRGNTPDLIADISGTLLKHIWTGTSFKNSIFFTDDIYNEHLISNILLE